ncbi:MAG TPA: protein kinase, partial [Tepidisphaeraceae bacterium]|nr:protein kinase [Tepidisphaeraceae bacterium]
GRVFRAEDTLLHRNVALKVLPKLLRRGEKTIAAERLVSEARAAATLDHPNVVTVFEVNEAGGVYYIAMELLEGGSLREIVKAAGPVDYPRACLLCAEAAAGLGQAHATGIIHRDVKPANLMLTRSGRCKVVDFGLARMDDANDLGTSAPESAGTPQFIAPELLRGSQASAQSDIYSLGGTLWYILTGRPPFPGPTSREMLRQHLEAPLPDLEAQRPDLPPGLVQALRKALAKRPADRFASAEQFEKVLRLYTVPTDASASGSLSALAAGYEMPAAQRPAPVQAPRSRYARFGQRPVLVGVASVLAIAIVALIVGKIFWPSAPAQSNAGLVGAQRPAASGHDAEDGAPVAPQEGANAQAQPISAQPASAQIHTPTPATPAPLNLLANLNVAAASVKGNWTLKNGQITSDSSGPAMLEFPAPVPSEYDFRIEFTPQDCVEQLLYKPSTHRGSAKGTAFNWCMGVGEVCGFESLNGMHVFDNNSPLTRRLPLQLGIRHTSVVKVRKDGVQSFLDGQLIVAWKTDYHDLSRADDWSMRDNDRLGIGTWNKPTVFHKVELIDRTQK